MIEPSHVEFMNSAWGIFTQVMAVIAALYAAFKTSDAIKQGIRKRALKAQAMENLRADIENELSDISKKQTDRDDAQSKKIDQIIVSVKQFREDHDRHMRTLTEELQEIGAQTATLQNEKMQWAYSYYGKMHKPIPMVTRNALEQMYEQYTRNNKRNHIPNDFLDVIHSAPILDVIEKDGGAHEHDHGDGESKGP